MTEAPPVTISIVGTGSTTGGGVAPTPSGTIAETPNGQPDLLVNVVPPIIALLVRAGNVFITAGLGALTTAGLGATAGAATLPPGTAWKVALTAALVASGIETAKNLVTIFGRLEGKYPLATGSI